MASLNQSTSPSEHEKVAFAVDASQSGGQPEPIARRNTPWPRRSDTKTGQNGTSLPPTSRPLESLFAALRADFNKDHHKPELKMTAIRAQIMGMLPGPFRQESKLIRASDNALAIATMACVNADYAGETLKVDEPKLFIVTTNEGDQVQAAVVYYQYQPEQHSKVGTVFKGALAGSDAEAILSLYEESKKVATTWKGTLESRSLWSIG